MNIAAIGARLRASSWSELGAYAVVLTLLGKLAVQATPASAIPQLRHAGLAMALLLLASKDIAHAGEAWHRLRRVHTLRAPWHQYPLALLPPELVGMFKVDRLMWIGMAQRLRGRQPAPIPEGEALGYLERGSYGTARALVFASLLLELPVHALLLNLWITDPAALAAIHIAGAIAVVYTLAWVLGDRWHLGAGRHVLAGEFLHLRVGVRTEGVLPLAAIERMETVDEQLPAWRRKRGVAACDTLTVTPFDKPNCVLVLKEDAQVAVLHWQVRRRLPRYVFLYLDRPALLRSRMLTGLPS